VATREMSQIGFVNCLSVLVASTKMSLSLQMLETQLHCISY